MKKSRSIRSHDPFLAREKAKYENPLPSREFILETLVDAGVPMRDLDLAKALGLHKNERPDGEKANVPAEFIANNGKEVKGNFIKLSVAADGKSYTVSIPASGHEQTYQTRNP